MTPFSASASTSRVPCRSVNSRTSSIFKLPAAADDPSRLRPNRAPSSSAQSTSLSVTGGFVPACIRSASSPASTPRHPSSHPPLGTESRWLPTMTVRLDAPGSVTQRLPAESLSTRKPSAATLPLNQSRASRHIGPHARRCAPSGVEVRTASSRRSAITRCAFMSPSRSNRIPQCDADRDAHPDKRNDGRREIGIDHHCYPGGDMRQAVLLSAVLEQDEPDAGRDERENQPRRVYRHSPHHVADGS